MTSDLRIVLIRHGETTANAEGRMQGHADFPLSEVGRAQAERLRERLEAEGFQPTHAYTSPLLRTSQTAEVLATSWQAPVNPWEDLIEFDVGSVEGMTHEEAALSLPGVDLSSGWTPEIIALTRGEPLMARRQRGHRVAKALVGRHGAGDVVAAVTHGGIVAHVIAGLLGMDRTWGQTIGNTAVFEFVLDTERWSQDGDSLANTQVCRIVRFNDASHLR